MIGDGKTIQELAWIPNHVVTPKHVGETSGEVRCMLLFSKLELEEIRLVWDELDLLKVG